MNIDRTVVDAIDNAQADVLLLEDHLIVQKGLGFIFDSFGLTVYPTSTREEAIAQFQPGKYRMVLLDLRLSSGMDSYTVAKHLREMEKGTSFRVPLIGISAYALPDEKRKAYEAGMDEIYAQPLLFEQVKALLARYAIFSQRSS